MTEISIPPQTFLSMLNANGALIITSCGMSLVMITGGIDISVGGVVALVSMCSAVYLDYHNGSILGAVLISLGIGLAFGIVQGYLVAYLDIQPFIVSLAGMFFARGMTTIVNTNPFNVQNEAFVALKDTRVIVPGLGSVNKLGRYVDAYVEIGVVVALWSSSSCLSCSAGPSWDVVSMLLVATSRVHSCLVSMSEEQSFCHI